MATSIILGYSGSLNYFGGNPKKRGLKDYFWTYNHQHTDDSSRSPFYLFAAIQKLHAEKVINPSNFKMLFWGSIDKRNTDLARKQGISDYLEVRGYLTKQESLETLRTCSLLFLPMESSGLGEPLFIPGKLFEYLNTRKPIFALCEKNSDVDIILRNAGNSIISAPKDIDGIASTLSALVKNPELLNTIVLNEEYIGRFTWERTTAQVAGIFNELLKNEI